MMSWAKATFYRVVRTGAQAAIGAIGAAAVFSEIAWDEVGGVVAIAMLLSFLMALAGLPETPERAPLEGAVDDQQGQTVREVVLVALIAAAVCFAILVILDLIQIT